jgi:hypothetical protein
MSESLSVADRGGRQARDEKLENLIMNHSMIFTGIFDEAFSAIADKMTEALGEGMSGSNSIGTADLGKKAGKEVAPEVLIQIGYAFSGIREEMASEWPRDASVFAQYVSSPAFDRGIEIVEKYDFGRPKLTEKLTDEVLASYVFLLQSGDKELGKMFKELADWQSGLPKPPWAD